MGLAILGIFYVILATIAVIIQILLYKSNSGSKYSNMIFILNMIFALFLSYISYTSFPSNYYGQKIISIFWAIMAIVGVITRSKTKQNLTINKIILSISIIGSFIQPLI